MSLSDFYHSPQPDSKGKYVFDIGCQQHGVYTGVEQPDDKQEEEEASPNMIPKWKAGDITEIKLEPDEDDLTAEAGDSTKIGRASCRERV